jgi:hypothetical protein
MHRILLLRYLVLGFVAAMLILFAVLAAWRHSGVVATIIVRVLSLLGFVVQGIFLGICIMLGGLSDGPPPDLVATLLAPTIWLLFIYFAFCFMTSFRRFRGFGLLFAGIAVHVLIIPFSVHMMMNGAGVFALLPFILAPFWFLMSAHRVRVYAA